MLNGEFTFSLSDALLLLLLGNSPSVKRVRKHSVENIIQKLFD
jgi:hypothetical protein